MNSKLTLILLFGITISFISCGEDTVIPEREMEEIVNTSPPECTCDSLIGKRWYYASTGDREDLRFENCNYFEDFILNDDNTISLFRYYDEVENRLLDRAAKYEIIDGIDGCRFRISELDTVKYEGSVLDSIGGDNPYGLGCWSSGFFTRPNSPIQYRKLGDQTFITENFSIYNETDLNGNLLNDTITCSEINFTQRFLGFYDRQP